MRIKVGDKIKVSNGLEGTVYSISIALDYHDKKAEYGIEVNQYDTELDYIGTVSYDDNENKSHWTYFNQIISVVPQEDNVKLSFEYDDIVHKQLFGIK